MRHTLIAMTLTDDQRLVVQFEQGGVISPVGVCKGMSANMVAAMFRRIALDIERSFCETLTPEMDEKIKRIIAKMAMVEMVTINPSLLREFGEAEDGEQGQQPN